MKRHQFGYFFREGITNMFAHGFMSFVAIGTTIACLLIMGTFSLVAYNAEEMLRELESDNQILAFVDDTYSRAQAQAIQEKLETIDNVALCTFITKEEAGAAYEAQYEGDYMLQDLDPTIFRDRYAIQVEDMSLMGDTAEIVENVTGIAKVRMDEDIAMGFTALRNVASAVCIALIAILLVVSIFIISNTIKLTTFDRRDEIAIMKMVGATNSFIRWPFVYEGFMMGILSAGIAFALQWLLYAAVAKSIAVSDVLQLIKVVEFSEIWRAVALVFAGTGILIGVGGSLTAIRKFLHV